MNREQRLRRRIQRLTWLFITGLALGGTTAIPLPGELNLPADLLRANGGSSELARWFWRVRDALAQTQAQHPFLFNGTNWPAFGHFVIALVFVGAGSDPVRNRWLFDFRLIAWGLLIPSALVFGGLRGTPFWWRLIELIVHSACWASFRCGSAASGPKSWSLVNGDKGGTNPSCGRVIARPPGCRDTERIPCLSPLTPSHLRLQRRFHAQTICKLNPKQNLADWRRSSAVRGVTGNRAG